MLEEHVYQLPLRAHVAGGEGEAAALACDAKRHHRLGMLAEGQRDVLRLDQERYLGAHRAALGGECQRGQRALAHDHRMHELHRNMARVRARDGAVAKSDQPPAARETLGHAVTQLRDALGLAPEENVAGCPATVGGGEGESCHQATAPARAGGPAASEPRTRFMSQSRSASTPSPVRALVSRCSIPGCTTWRL